MPSQQQQQQQNKNKSSRVSFFHFIKNYFRLKRKAQIWVTQNFSSNSEKNSFEIQFVSLKRTQTLRTSDAATVTF